MFASGEPPTRPCNDLLRQSRQRAVTEFGLADLTYGLLKSCASHRCLGIAALFYHAVILGARIPDFVITFSSNEFLIDQYQFGMPRQVVENVVHQEGPVALVECFVDLSNQLEIGRVVNGPAKMGVVFVRKKSSQAERTGVPPHEWSDMFPVSGIRRFSPGSLKARKTEAFRIQASGIATPRQQESSGSSRHSHMIVAADLLESQDRIHNLRVNERTIRRHANDGIRLELKGSAVEAVKHVVFTAAENRVSELSAELADGSIAFFTGCGNNDVFEARGRGESLKDAPKHRPPQDRFQDFAGKSFRSNSSLNDGGCLHALLLHFSRVVSRGRSPSVGSARQSLSSNSLGAGTFSPFPAA